MTRGTARPPRPTRAIRGIHSAETTPADSPWPRLLTLEQTGLYLGGLDARSVRRLLVSGEIPVLRVGVRRVLIDRHGLDRWVSAHVGAWDPEIWE